MEYAAALTYLDQHTNYERLVAGHRDIPSLERMQRLTEAMGDPQRAYAVIHITGTNGKGSTAQIVTRLLAAHGLSVGTYSSPHLERINERIARNGEPISDDEFGQMIESIAELEVITGARPTYFEAVTAAAYRWFADLAVDVAVIEVGMLGRWDATNVADGQVAVVTNVGLDHTEYAGPTLAHIAAEKAGIVKPGSALVLGATDPQIAAIFKSAGPAYSVERELDFDVIGSTLAVGGRVFDLRTAKATYSELYLPLNGAYQGDNAVAALSAAEAFFDEALDPAVIEEAFAEVRMPGRLEVVGHQPLVVVDGAHNPDGAQVLLQSFEESFALEGERILVVGLLRGRDPVAMLDLLEVDRAKRVITCTPDSPRAFPAHELAEAARKLGADATPIDDVRAACDEALAAADPEDAVLVCGSLYVVGAARPHLRARAPKS